MYTDTHKHTHKHTYVYIHIYTHSWVCEQRQLYEQSELEESRAARLQEIAFVFDSAQVKQVRTLARSHRKTALALAYAQVYAPIPRTHAQVCRV